jgi:D-xylose transport system substrate-binding protein
MPEENTTIAQPSPELVQQPVVPATQSNEKTHGKPFAIVLVVLLAVILVAVGVFYFLNKNSSQKSSVPTTPTKVIHIGLSLDTLAEARWAKDRDLMTQDAQAKGASVVTLVANNDDNTQIAQIQNFIAQKMDVIIIIAHNAQALSDVIDQAHKAGIKIIAYDRMILNSNPDLYVSFDSVKVGEFAAQYVMAAVSRTVAVPNVVFIGGSPTDHNATLVRDGAMSVLDPLVKAGKAKLVFDQYTDDWNPTIAYGNLEVLLNKGEKVDAIVSSNDGMATGVVKALAERGLAGKVPVSGQDADLTAVKRLVDGTQAVTLYKPIASEAERAIEGAIDLATGKTPQTNGVMSNGKIDVPSYLINPIPVTKDTIKTTVIKDGFYSSKDVYGN